MREKTLCDYTLSLLRYESLTVALPRNSCLPYSCLEAASNPYKMLCICHSPEREGR